jgi:hypothetical protein
VTLERGALAGEDRFRWVEDLAVTSSGLSLTDHDDKRVLDIVRQNRDGITRRRWTLTRAWPVKFFAGEWDDESDENGIEWLTQAYRFSRTRAAGEVENGRHDLRASTMLDASMSGDPKEPFSIEWDGGACSIGYLGRDNWRCRLSTGGVADASSTPKAVALLLADALGGIPAGQEVHQRARLSVRVGSVDEFTLVGDARVANGWTMANSRLRFDLGDQSQLAIWIEAIVRRNADRLWARGEVPSKPAPLGDEFAFTEFKSDADPTDRCHRLEAMFAARLADHPSPEAVLESAATELRALGHDLWSWENDRMWGWDYVTKRSGGGMRLSLCVKDDDDDGPGEAPRIAVEFRSPK